MTQVVMVVKSVKVDKVAFVPACIQKWMLNTSTQSSGVISLPPKVLKEVEKFYGRKILNEIPYRAMSFEDDVMNYFHKQSETIVGVKKAQNYASQQKFEIVDDYFVGDENEFILSEMSE